MQHVAEKAAEKYEAQSRDLQGKVEELNKHVNDLAQQRQRLQQENNDILKDLHETKVQVDNLQHLKHQLAQQLEEARRRLEDAERVRKLYLKYLMAHERVKESGNDTEMDLGSSPDASAVAPGAVGAGQHQKCPRRGSCLPQ